MNPGPRSGEDPDIAGIVPGPQANPWGDEPEPSQSRRRRIRPCQRRKTPVVRMDNPLDLSKPITQVGLVGVGVMGAPMARNLMKAGFGVVAWNRTRARLDALVGDGARAGNSAADVAARSELVITIVSDSPDVVSVATGADGVFAGARPGTIVVDMSTISPAVTRDLAAQASAQNLTWLDAPVSGGEAGAIAGTLTIMVGGDAPAFARAQPVLAAMGSRVTQHGPVGPRADDEALQSDPRRDQPARCERGAPHSPRARDSTCGEGLLGARRRRRQQLGARSWGARCSTATSRPRSRSNCSRRIFRPVADAARDVRTPVLGIRARRTMLRTPRGRTSAELGTQALIRCSNSWAP